jgi:MFS family permease
MNYNKKYRIPLFCFITFLYWASLYTYVPVLTLYLESLGATHKMAGIIVGSYGFVQMLLRIPVGIVSDRYRKRKLFISIGISFSLFSALGLLLFHDLSLILFFRGLAGVAAATWVDFTILFSSYYKKEESSKAIGTINFYNTLGQSFAMFIGSYAADSYGINSVFILGIIIAAIGLLLSAFIIEKFEENIEPLTIKSVIQVASNKILIIVSFFAILSQVVTFSTVFGFTPVFASNVLNISKFEAGILTISSSLPTAIASLIAGRILVKRYKEGSIIFIGFLLTGIFTISIPFTNSIWLLILTQVIAGFGRGLSFPMLMGLSIKNIEQNKRATAMGFFQAIYGLGMFAGPVFMGFIGDLLSLREGFIGIGIFSLFTALLAKLSLNKIR